LKGIQHSLYLCKKKPIIDQQYKLAKRGATINRKEDISPHDREEKYVLVDGFLGFKGASKFDMIPEGEWCDLFLVSSN